jgi:hypothetical protein
VDETEGENTMDRDNMVPGTQPRAGTGTDGQELGIAGAQADRARYADPADTDDASIRERGAGFVERGREKVSDAIDDGRERVEDAIDDGRERVGSALDAGKLRLADGISRIGTQLDERATRFDEDGTLGGRAGRYMHRASDMAQDSAEYLRTHDLDIIGDDIVGQIRARPLLSCGVALGAGFLLGSAGSGGRSSRREREDSDRDDDRYDADRYARRRDRDDDDESTIRSQLGRAVVSGITTLLTREIHARVAGRDRGRDRS